VRSPYETYAPLEPTYSPDRFQLHRDLTPHHLRRRDGRRGLAEGDAQPAPRARRRPRRSAIRQGPRRSRDRHGERQSAALPARAQGRTCRERRSTPTRGASSGWARRRPGTPSRPTGRVYMPKLALKRDRRGGAERHGTQARLQAEQLDPPNRASNFAPGCTLLEAGPLPANPAPIRARARPRGRPGGTTPRGRRGTCRTSRRHRQSRMSTQARLRLRQGVGGVRAGEDGGCRRYRTSS
jgi:hypothetical protein